MLRRGLQYEGGRYSQTARPELEFAEEPPCFNLVAPVRSIK